MRRNSRKTAKRRQGRVRGEREHREELRLYDVTVRGGGGGDGLGRRGRRFRTHAHSARR